MSYANASFEENNARGRARGLSRARVAWMLALGLAAAGVAQAQAPGTGTTGERQPNKPTDQSLTWNGITLYGIIDIGLQYQTHGAPISDYFPAGTEALIQKNSNGSVTGLTPSNLSQSRFGISGKEPIVGDWSGVFRFETFINPQSGNLSDALKSQVLNNGIPAASQTTNVDSSIAGQLFAGAANAGFSSPTYGTITFGRNVTTLADGIGKYDPMGAANAFSLIGFSGTAAGGGVTEDRRLDQSLKYVGKFGGVHLGGLYQFSGSSGARNTAEQVMFGLERGGGSIDAFWAKKYDAIATSPLNATQVGNLQTHACNGPAQTYDTCAPLSHSLSGTVSDNTTYSVMGLYGFGAPTVFAGWERIKFANPSNPLPPGSLTIGGYILAFTNNTAYGSATATEKVLQVYWAGVKYAASPQLDMMAAFYGYHQNAFAVGAKAGCSDHSSGACSGDEATFAFVLDYKYSKRFDTYVGTFWSQVKDGLANGYDLNTSTLTTTAGLRFKF